MRRERELIGVIEDDPIMGGTLAQRLELEGYNPLWWRTGQEALEALGTARPDLVICDIRLPDMSGEDIFLKAIPLLKGKPFLFVTAFGEIEQAVRLTKAGAVDYLAKPYAMPDLLGRIAQLMALRPNTTDALGTSQVMRQVEMLLRRVANIDSLLLLTGESGVGKEVAARFVHKISTRAQGPFRAVNCAAIPSELIESELFGHEKGAFTGAHSRHQGYFEQARDGILFLDEVGELPLQVQAKLLRLIEDRTFTRVGGEASINANARLICATNADLKRAVAEGRFRDDLYYRINVISVLIPPLRDRRDDILLLAQKFMRDFAGAFGRHIQCFTSAAEQALLEHPWSGNVRELRNCVERAVALSDTPWIGVDALLPSEPAESLGAEGRYRTLAQVRDRAERDHIRAVRAHVGMRVEETARLLGVSRRTLFEKMRKLNIRSDG